MTLRFKTVKPGTLMVCKRYNVFTILWYKLRKKELPYNFVNLFINKVSIVDVYNDKSTEVLLEPKKEFTNQDVNKLLGILDTYYYDVKDKGVIGFKISKNKDMSILSDVLDKIRPSSFNMINFKDFNISDRKVREKYYVTKLAEERNWDLCIY